MINKYEFVKKVWKHKTLLPIWYRGRVLYVCSVTYFIQENVAGVAIAFDYEVADLLTIYTSNGILVDSSHFPIFYMCNWIAQRLKWDNHW